LYLLTHGKVFLFLSLTEIKSIDKNNGKIANHENSGTVVEGDAVGDLEAGC
jgi:hypothetical protein